MEKKYVIAPSEATRFLCAVDDRDAKAYRQLLGVRECRTNSGEITHNIADDGCGFMCSACECEYPEYEYSKHIGVADFCFCPDCGRKVE